MRTIFCQARNGFRLRIEAGHMMPVSLNFSRPGTSYPQSEERDTLTQTELTQTGAIALAEGLKHLLETQKLQRSLKVSGVTVTLEYAKHSDTPVHFVVHPFHLPLRLIEATRLFGALRDYFSLDIRLEMPQDQ